MVTTLACTVMVCCLVFIKNQRVGEYEVMDQTFILYLLDNG